VLAEAGDGETAQRLDQRAAADVAVLDIKCRWQMEFRSRMDPSESSPRTRGADIEGAL